MGKGNSYKKALKKVSKGSTSRAKSSAKKSALESIRKTVSNAPTQRLRTYVANTGKMKTPSKKRAAASSRANLELKNRTHKANRKYGGTNQY